MEALWDTMPFWTVLGVGACGPVSLATINKNQYAVKMVCKFKSHKSSIEQLKNESVILRHLENERKDHFYNLFEIFPI